MYVQIKCRNNLNKQVIVVKVNQTALISYIALERKIKNLINMSFYFILRQRKGICRHVIN